MASKYKIISENDVFNILIQVDLDFMSVLDCINLVNIASLLSTSRYQVKKHMDRLVKSGIAEIKRTVIYEEDYIMPYCGYKITNHIKEKSDKYIPPQYNKSNMLRCRAMYQNKKSKHEQIVEKYFG